MTKFIGRRVNLGVAAEATRGIGLAPTRTVPKIDVNLEDKANKATSEESFSNIAGYGNDEVVTQQFAEGDIGGEINLKSYPLFLWATFGTMTSAAEGAGYKHTLAIADSNQHKSLSISTKDDNGQLLWRRSMIDSHEITINPEEIVKFTCGIKARVSKANSWTASYETKDYKFVGRDLELKVAANTAGLGAATGIRTKEMTLTISKNSDYDIVNSSLEPEDIHNKQFTIECSLTLNYEDRTWVNYMLDGDYKAVGIKLTDTRDDLGAGLNPELYFEFPRVAFAEWERDNSNDDIVSQSLNFKVLYDQLTGKYISNAYVINDVVSY